MDENNLDSLLDELSSMDGELNENIDIDSGVDVDADDMDDISLDELDHLDGMDLGDLDFDDIDFDDVDITKLDAGANPVVNKKPQEQETDDMSLDALIEKANQENVKPEPPQEETSVQADNTDVFGEADLQMQEDTALPEGVFDDALFGSMDMGMSEEPELSEKGKNPYTADEDSLDALLQSSMAESLLNGDLADIEDIGEKPGEPVKKVKQPRKKAEKKKKAEIEEEETEHKKKTISEILFGEPDEDDLEEEALFEEKKAKKEAEKKKKQAEREAKKEEKDAAKQEMLTAKQAKDKAKQKEKADKKRQKDEAYAADTPLSSLQLPWHHTSSNIFISFSTPASSSLQAFASSTPSAYNDMESFRFVSGFSRSLLISSNLANASSMFNSFFFSAMLFYSPCTPFVSASTETTVAWILPSCRVT